MKDNNKFKVIICHKKVETTLEAACKNISHNNNLISMAQANLLMVQSNKNNFLRYKIK